MDRRTEHHRDALTLARNILLNSGRTLVAGSAPAWTFLIRTPLAVEAGVRAVLRDTLGAKRVSRYPEYAVGAPLAFDPYLVFDGGIAVRDVEHKVSDGTWNRSDLNQAVTFAEAFGCRDLALLRFRPRTVRRLGPV